MKNNNNSHAYCLFDDDMPFSDSEIHEVENILDNPDTFNVSLSERLENAYVWRATDLRSIRESIYRLYRRPICEFISSETAVNELIEEGSHYEMIITPESTYGDVIDEMYSYLADNLDGFILSDFSMQLLQPAYIYSRYVNWCNFPGENAENIESVRDRNISGTRKTLLKKYNVSEFFVWMDQYVKVLDYMFPGRGYEEVYNEHVHMKPPYEKQPPILMEYIYGLFRDPDLFEADWHIFAKLMFEPFHLLRSEERMKIREKLMNNK